METKELNVEVPKGFEIDKDKSSFEKIIFKKKESTCWRDNKHNYVNGVWINGYSELINSPKDIYLNTKEHHSIFATERQAKSALAMAQISQIMANDERFGGVITDEEWDNGMLEKYCIIRYKHEIDKYNVCDTYCFLAFHTKEQCDLFLKENEDLVKDYLMIDV